MADELLKSPEGLVERSDDFLDVAETPANAGLFGLDASALSNWRAQTDAMQGLLTQREALQHQLEGVQAQIKSQAPELEATARAGLRVAAASSAPADKKAEAGVTIPKPRVLSAPIVPTKLLAQAVANGTVELVWERAGNTRTTKFIVEKRVAGEWVLVDIVTATTLTTSAKIGERAAFRVTARNGQGTSLPSNEAVIYDG